MMNRKIRTEAWTLNSPLNVFGVHELAARAAASSARMSIAIRPPTNRKKNEWTTYWIPMTLWSVLSRK